jgi:predicted nucleic acid-binding protein
VNTSPLILLSKIGLLDLLRAGDLPVIVPQAVLNEIARHGPTDQTVLQVLSAGWLQIVPDPPIPPRLVTTRLGSGELAVIALALAQPGSEVVLDDLTARRCARESGLSVQGTISLVIQAKHRGAIPSVRPVLDQLRGMGMYLSDRFVDQVRKAAGE